MKKKKYQLSALVTVSIYTEVEAKSKEAAITIAQEREMTDIICAGGSTKKDAWICDELDGHPKSIVIV